MEDTFMYEYDATYLDELTESSPADRASLIRWIAKQGEATHVELMKLQGDLVKQSRDKQAVGKKSEFFFAMLILAAKKMRWLEQAPSQKISLTNDENKKLREMRIARIKTSQKRKEAPQKALIRVRYYEEIKKLREGGLSWRQIQEYIKTHHKKNISWTYLQRVYADLTAERVILDVN